MSGGVPRDNPLPASTWSVPRVLLDENFGGSSMQLTDLGEVAHFRAVGDGPEAMLIKLTPERAEALEQALVNWRVRRMARFAADG